MDVERLLGEEIVDEFKELKKLDVGSDKHKMAVDSIMKLVDRKIELEKTQIEHDEKITSREAEQEIKEAQLKAEKRNNFAKNAIAVGTTVVTVGSGLLVAFVTLKYDEKGVFPTNIPGKQAISKFINKIF
jgi:hypothetical protein